ncbi:MAG: DUF4162 domain-containing protein, partial [Bacteroidales bacterium]
ILSTHNTESVEELCDNIALINKSNLIITGNVDEIRREHGNNQVELLYRNTNSLEHILNSSLYTIVSDQERKNSRRAILEVPREVKSTQVLGELIKEVDIISYQELIPRMNDIFIKLVSASN